MPGDTRAALVEHIRRAVNDEAVQVLLEDANGWEASPVSPVDSPVYRSLSQAIRQAFPDAVVAPYLFAAVTDSRYYTGLCPAVYRIKLTRNIFRFSPDEMTSELLRTVHGIDERIGIDDLAGMVSFYSALMKSWTQVVGS
jgi:carboxypeptidase PM20D1